MQPGKHPDAVTWNEPSDHTVINLWIDYDGSHIIDSDGSRIIIGNYMDSNAGYDNTTWSDGSSHAVAVSRGSHIPSVAWSPGA